MGNVGEESNDSITQEPYLPRKKTPAGYAAENFGETPDIFKLPSPH